MSRPACLCGGRSFAPVFDYKAPPAGETKFPFTEKRYRRKVVRCRACGHFLSVHSIDLDRLYRETYVTSTYGAGGMRKTFERIIGLDPSKSDNTGRVKRIVGYWRASRAPGRRPRALDVGSGLCVFLYRLKSEGFDCTGLDNDPRQVRHAREVAGVKGVLGRFETAKGLGRYDLITFNKVLEHVVDPVRMLARARRHLAPGGLVYVELPDGEAASLDGPGREEFFIEHWHVFSMASLDILAQRAGFRTLTLERLREPSGKYTLFAFLTSATPEG